jgi:hypothetical protein
MTTLSRGAPRTRSQLPRSSSLRPCVSLRCGTGYLTSQVCTETEAEQFLGKRRDLGGVEEVDAGVKGGVEEAQRARRPVLLPHRHRPCKDATRTSGVSAVCAELPTQRERERELRAGPKQRRETGSRSGVSWKVGMAISPLSLPLLLLYSLPSLRRASQGRQHPYPFGPGLCFCFLSTAISNNLLC